MGIPFEAGGVGDPAGQHRSPSIGLTGPEHAELVSSIAALSHLSTGRLALSDILTEVAQLAVHAIPGADGAGLTLTEKDRGDTIVATATFVRDVDSIQYELREGPCISAAAEGGMTGA